MRIVPKLFWLLWLRLDCLWTDGLCLRESLPERGLPERRQKVPFVEAEGIVKRHI